MATLQERIAERRVWTFKDCLGLAAEFNMKPRAVVVMVLAQGATYVDGDTRPAPTAEPPPPASGDG